MITYDTLLCLSMICSSTVVVFASSKGPINYLKVFVNNKKIEKPEQILPVKRVVSTNPTTAEDQGTPTRMTFRDVYKYEATDNSVNNHMTVGGCDNNQVTEYYDKRIVGDDKTVTRHPVDDALVQRMCLDIASAVHRQISEQAMGVDVSGTTASGITTHWKSEHQQKKQQQQKHQHHQQQQQKQQQQKQEQQQQKSQQKKQQQHQHKQQKEQHKQQKELHKQQKEQHKHKQQQHKQQQQQQPQQMPQKRRRNSYQKFSPRSVSYIERKDSGIVTVGPHDRYNGPTVKEKTSRTDSSTSIGVVDEDVDNSKQDEDADQSSKVWEVNMVDDYVMVNSVKSHEQRPEAFATPAAITTSVTDYDDGNQTA